MDGIVGGANRFTEIHMHFRNELFLESGFLLHCFAIDDLYSSHHCSFKAKSSISISGNESLARLRVRCKRPIRDCGQYLPELSTAEVERFTPIVLPELS